MSQMSNALEVVLTLNNPQAVSPQTTEYVMIDVIGQVLIDL